MAGSSIVSSNEQPWGKNGKQMPEALRKFGHSADALAPFFTAAGKEYFAQEEGKKELDAIVRQVNMAIGNGMQTEAHAQQSSI
jgi:hypothetical protein